MRKNRDFSKCMVVYRYASAVIGQHAGSCSRNKHGDIEFIGASVDGGKAVFDVAEGCKAK